MSDKTAAQFEQHWRKVIADELREDQKTVQRLADLSVTDRVENRMWLNVVTAYDKAILRAETGRKP